MREELIDSICFEAAGRVTGLSHMRKDCDRAVSRAVSALNSGYMFWRDYANNLQWRTELHRSHKDVSSTEDFPLVEVEIITTEEYEDGVS